MLIGLTIRDIVLVEALDLGVGAGLTTLTGETGAGKSIILGALGLAAGGKADAGLVRRGAAQASATAIFALGPDSEVWSYLRDKALAGEPDEDLVLRRTLSADGRSRAFVNDQATSIGVLRELGGLLMESHGQHETVGLLDPRTHRPQLDAFGGCAALADACAGAWKRWRAARAEVDLLEAAQTSAGEEGEELSHALAELDRLSPRAGEAAELAETRAVLGAAEKTLADVDVARDQIGGEVLRSRLGQGFRALERARDRALASGLTAENRAVILLVAAEMIGADRFWPGSRPTPFQNALAPQAAAAGIVMRGYMPHAEVLKAMAQAAIVVVPSRWAEPFGLTALEAMASGAALICSRRGGLPEVAGQAALYADPDEPGALEAAMTRLMDDAALRARMAVLGLERAPLFDATRARARLLALRCMGNMPN